MRLLRTELCVLLGEAPDYIGAVAHTEPNTHTVFSLFMSSGLGLCDRLNSLVCNLPD